VEEVSNFSHKRPGLAGVEIYETRRTPNKTGFEIRKWGGGAVLGGKSRINKRRSIPETFEGCGEKGLRRWRRNMEEDY